ncbi:MFS transporter [Streptomyces caniferus]|uniref:MFS transporter n=1 Tax=Streptomyces caniferus TaxID=285557 RepID=UPI003818106D
MLEATGSGIFLTGSAFYFTHEIGLSAAQVGSGLTIAGVAAFVTGVPLGRLADRFGKRRVWFISGLLFAMLYFAWPVVHGFGGFVALVVLAEVIDSALSSARGAYTLDAFSPEERVRSMAFIKAALNIGFALGAGIGGIALALPTDAGIRALPYATAVMLVLGALLILRLPKADQQHAAPAAGLPTARTALRNRGYLATSVMSGVLGTNQVLLNVVIPLWIVEQTDAPRILLSLLFATNTVLTILLQVPASRGANTLSGALRASRRSAAFFALSCIVVLFTHNTIGWVTITVALLAHIALTGAELFAAAGQWGFQAELSDTGRRGEYQGVARVGIAFGNLWAPALYTWLITSLHGGGWLVIAAIVTAAAACLGPSARSAEAFLRPMAASASAGPVRTSTTK